jgi:DNA-binding beta-propeller fold protein YncE
VIETDLEAPEIAALHVQALIEEAKRRRRQRRRKLGFRLVAAVLLLGIAIGAAVILSGSHSQPSTKAAPPFASTTTQVNHSAYVTTTHGIYEVNLATKRIVRWIDPHGSQLALDPVAIAPNGQTAYVVSDNVLTPIDLRSGLAKAPVTLGSATGGKADSLGLPSSIAIAPNGQSAYVAIPAQGTVVPVHLAPLSAGSPIYVGGAPRTIAIARDGSTAYVSNSSSDAIDIVNLATDSVGLPINGLQGPQGIAVTPDGQRAYVTASNGVVPIDLTSRGVFAPIGVASIGSGSVPGPIAVSADGRSVYIANTESATGDAAVTVVSTASNTVIARLGGFSGPADLSLVNGTHTLYVLNTAPYPGAVISGGTGSGNVIEENALVPVDLTHGRLQTPIPIPATPRSFGIG